MVGLVGKKMGMTQVFDDQGVLTPVTVIEVVPSVVIAQKAKEKDGYSAVVLGAVDQKPRSVIKPHAGRYKDLEGVSPKKHLVEIRDFERECSLGDTVGSDVMKDIPCVDVVGLTKGKGFQGVVKRYGFKGGCKTHGSKFHREGGSTGVATHQARVIKGKKMAGRMGGVRQTVQNLRVVKVDVSKSVVLVKGAVPGKRGGLLLVRGAKKKG